MKKLIGLVVIIAVLVLGSYYGMGLVTERTLKKNVDVINQSNGLYVDIERYDRGWFTSTAMLNWRLHIPERLTKDQNGQSKTVPAQDFTLQMPLAIYHGPIIYSDTGVRFGLGYAHSDLTIPQAYAQKFSNLLATASTEPTLDLSISVNFFNKSRLHIRLPMFKLIAKQGGDQFEWLGMDSSVSVSSDRQVIDGHLTIEGASLIKNKMKAILGHVNSEYKLHQTEAGIYLGEAALTMPSLVVQDSDQKILDVEQFSLHSSNDMDGGLFNSFFQTSLDKITVHGKTYGPAMLDMSIKNLDAKVLGEMNEQINKMQQGTDTERQQALFALLPELPKLFSKGAQFEISKLSLVMPEGAVKGALLVSLPKGDAGNPFQLLQKVQGHGSLKIPATVVKGLVMASVRQKLLSQPTLQQAMVQQMKNDDPAQMNDPAISPASDPTSAPASDPTKEQVSDIHSDQTQTSHDQSNPVAPADLDQQVTVQTNQKLSAMEQIGLLSLQGKEYVIEVNLVQGQLSVNGNPFNPAMIQF